LHEFDRLSTPLRSVLLLPGPDVDPGIDPQSLAAANRDFRRLEGCDLRWQRTDDGVAAVNRTPARCSVSTDLGTLSLVQSLRFDDRGLWLHRQISDSHRRDDFEQRFDRVRHYAGRLEHRSSGARFEVRLHDHGDSQTLRLTDGSKVTVRLRLWRPEGFAPGILRLSLSGNMQLLAASQAGADSEHIALETSTFQLSLVREAVTAVTQAEL